MNLIVLDFETYFDDSYSLSKMTTEAYVRDPRFEALGCGALAIAHDGQIIHSRFHTHPELAFKDVDWPSTAVLCHHAAFDGLILSHHYGIKPAQWLDTYSMAKLVHGAHVGKSLSSLAAHYNFPEKNVPYGLFKGKHWSDLDAATQRLVADGCLHDCELTYLIFQRMMESFPPEELDVIDITIRMFTEPKLVGDQALLHKVRDEEWFSKNQRLYELGVGERDLASADKFKAILEAEGVEVPMKPGKLKPIPAVAKTDAFMQELLDDDDERIASLALARIEVKSTLNETRSSRILEMAERGRLTVYLHYCGAHTTRWSGGDAVNFQNLPRGSDIRKGLRAPEGFLFAAPDQSQGECRILNWLAGQGDVIARFAQGHDPYLPMASAFYGREIFADDKYERQVGKTLELGCGFGMGGPKLQITAKRAGIELTPNTAVHGVAAYRRTHPEVVRLWREADDVIRALYAKQPMTWRDVLHAEGGRLYGPNGAWIDYTGLRWEEGEWRLYKTRGQWAKLYGAKLVENAVQFLSRIVTSQAMLRFRAAGYPIVGMSHDDVWLLIPDHEITEIQEMMIINIMAETPAWAPGLPLGAECKIGETYS